MRSNKPYVPLDPAVIEQARQIDLLTYLRDCEPSNLVKVKGTTNVYCTAEHDSLKISNGKWYWWSRGFGGVSALDYLMKVRGFGFVESIEILTGREFSYVPPPLVPKEQKEKVLLLPDRHSNNEQAHEVGVKLAERMWGDRFQVIVATHLNTDCLHNHFVLNSVSFADGKHYHDNKKNLRLLRKRSDELCREYALSVIEQPSGRKKPYALYQAEKQGLPTRDTVARQAVDEAISKSFTLKDFDRELLKMGYRINFDPNRKYWTIIGKGWQRPKRLYKLGEDYTNDRIVERIKENSYAVRFSQFVKSTKEVKVFRVRGTMKNARKIGGLRGLYLHYCYKLGILPKGRKQDYAKLHYLLKDDLMKMEMIAKETRLLCRCHIDTAEQLLSYQAFLTTEMAELTAKRKGLYSLSRKASGEEKEAVKAQISEITGRLNTIRKEVRLCEGIEVRSGVLKEKLQTIRTEEQETKREELMKNEHRRRSGRTNRPNELGGL